VDVRQLPASDTPPPPPPADCSFDLVPDNGETGPGASIGTVAVQTQAGCSWNAATDGLWLTIVAGATGRGAGQVTYEVSENSSASSRTGHISIETATFTLRQAGKAACSYEIDPTSASYGYGVYTGRIQVVAGPLCAWSASTPKSWIQITSGSSGVGTGEVSYRVRQNPTTGVRTGTIVIEGQTFTITQDAAPP
jgi:hypothetical protein